MKKRKKRETPAQKRERQKKRAQAIMAETTATIRTLIEKGIQPWIRPWYSAGPFRNAKTGHIYSKGNGLLLLVACEESGWGDPRFLGFRQAEALGGHVVKGQHGTAITKLHIWNAKKKGDENEEGEDEDIRTVRRLAWLHVFNVAQCADLELPRDEWTPPPCTVRNARVDGFLEAVGVPIRDGLETPYYEPKAGYVVVPPRARFHTPSHYYATCFHELTHWTGQHLGREINVPAAEPRAYAFEELVAELGSALLCAHFLVDDALTQHAAAYIDGWLELLADDDTAYHRAIVQAQKAVDFLLKRAGLLEDETALESAGNEVMA